MKSCNIFQSHGSSKFLRDAFDIAARHFAVMMGSMVRSSLRNALGPGDLPLLRQLSSFMTPPVVTPMDS